MDMSSSMSDGSCEISMLWNWTTINACFLAEGWRIQNNGMFAASCIGVVLLGVLLEAFRRLTRDFDNYALRQLSAARDARALSNAAPSSRPIRATALQQLIRAALHTITFGIAYILMLLAMYFNGYIIISILIGTAIGKFFCDWMTLGEGRVVLEAKEDECPTTCCG